MKRVEVSKEDFKYNISALKNVINESKRDDAGNRLEVIGVVKANGMGLRISPLL